MGADSTGELIEEFQLGMLIVIACIGVGIIGASLLRGLPAGMSIGFVLGALLTFLGLSVLLSGD